MTYLNFGNKKIKIPNGASHYAKCPCGCGVIIFYKMACNKLFRWSWAHLHGWAEIDKQPWFDIVSLYEANITWTKSIEEKMLEVF